MEEVVNIFQQKSDLIDSSYIIYKRKKQKFNYVKEFDQLRIFCDKSSYKNVLSEGDYDVVYFHSLPPENYWILKSIPDDKVVVWWSWGYDIYNGGMWGWTSFINIDSVKKQTKKTQLQSRGVNRTTMLFLCQLYYELYCRFKRNWVLKRIDYFQPVLSVEYNLMKKNKFFKAKEYYPPKYGPTFHVKMDTKKLDGSIIIGNSASAFNNHVDVWELIKSKIPYNRQVIVPLSYGTKKYADNVKKIINGRNITFLEKFLPVKEYYNIMNNCSYAVYGSIRQHAMGNIFHALSEGMKVFLFKNSIVYRYLKDLGFSVYALEEINNDSFNTPITIEEALQNEQAFNKMRRHCSIVIEESMKNIELQISKRL